MTNSGNSMQKTDQPNSEKIAPRRRFIGKGLKAAPFVLTLASQPSLGATCFTPSRSLSRNTSLSQVGKYGECTGAESPGNYKAQQDISKNAYHWPASVSPTDPFHPTFQLGGVDGVTKFLKNDGTQIVSMTFGEVLHTNASGQVAFHLIGAYLNVLGGNGAVIPLSVITTSGIQTIWAEYVTKGYYEPTAGVKWYADEIVAYLKTNGIVG